MNSVQPQVRVGCLLTIKYSMIRPHVMFTVCLQAIAPMQVYSQVYGDHGANYRPRGPDGKREWSYGLFDCFSRCGLCTSNVPT